MHRVTDPVHTEINKLLPGHDTLKKSIIEYIEDTIEEAVSTEQLTNPKTNPQQYQEDHELVKKLDEVIRRYIIMEKRSGNAIEGLRTIQSRGHVEQLEDVFSRAAEQNVNEDIVEQDERYKQFRKQIYEINRAPDFKPIRNEEDDELEVIASQSTIDVYDPFTKSVMEEPYKNRKCGHSYEKSSIEEVLKRSRGKPVDCPVVGCRQTIANMNDLEPNLHLQVAIRRKQKNKERGMEKDVTDDAIDIDED